MKKMEFNDYLFKRIVILFFVIIVLSLFASLFTYWDKQRIYDINSHKYIITEGGVSYVIDSIDYNGDAVSIIGWCYKPGQDIKNYDVKVVLNKVNTGIFKAIPTDMVIRKDVTEFFKDGFNYDCSGFSSKVFMNKLDDDSKYEIYILYENDSYNFLVKTNKYVSLGDLNNG